MKKQRPINLNLLTIQFPITAIISILHRVAGTVLFLFIPLFLWMLSVSLSNPDGFVAVQDFIANPFFKLFLLLLLAALFYHLIAGIRHLVMDMGVGEGLESARRSARWVIFLAVVLTLFAGIWLW